jgi:hypothetical protein
MAGTCTAEWKVTRRYGSFSRRLLRGSCQAPRQGQASRGKALSISGWTRGRCSEQTEPWKPG